MSPLVIRVLSALVAAFSLIALGYWGGAWALSWGSSLIILIGVNEFRRLAFYRIGAPALLQYWFLLNGTAVYLGVLLLPRDSFLMLCFCSSLFFAGSIWMTRNSYPNVKLLTALAMGNLGFIYFAAFPALAIKTLYYLDHGMLWFTLLLVVVFAGDTFAYFGGKFFGQKPLMPQISPKKTVEGAFSGLVGSMACGLAFIQFSLPHIPWYWVASFSLISGVLAQSGDLIVSLVKRVADVKDSGRIMPGHGGILDRLDGIYIASPVLYGFALLCESFLI